MRGQRIRDLIGDLARIDDVTPVHDVAPTLRVPIVDLLHLSNSPTRTCVMIRLQRTASPLRFRNVPPANENEASNDFAYCPVKASSNDRKHYRDHKKNRRPEQQVVASQ
jgi:hypothetical protein